MNKFEKSKELYEEGDKLAKIAVRTGMALDQLRKIHQMIKVKPLVDMVSLELVCAHARRQMIRVPGRAAFRKILEIINKYREDRKAIEEILTYSIYLYDFYRNEKVLNLIEVAISDMRGILRRYGLKLYDVYPKRVRGNFAEMVIITDKPPRDSARVAYDVKKVLLKKARTHNLNLKIWVKSK